MTRNISSRRNLPGNQLCKDGFSTQSFGVCLCFHHQGFVRSLTFPQASFIPKTLTATALNTHTRRGRVIHHINLSRRQEHGALLTNSIFTPLFVQDCTAYNRYENLKPYITSQAKCMERNGSGHRVQGRGVHFPLD
jgi:hypothetical protein